MTTQILSDSGIAGVHTGWRAARGGWTPAGIGLIARAVTRLLDWQDGVFERRRIADLSDHLLRDIGLTRSDLSQP